MEQGRVTYGDDDPSFEDLYGQSEQLEKDKIRIKIRDSKGKIEHYVEFNKTNTVGDLKNKISELMSINTDKFRLGPRFISGRPDNYLLNDINWGNDKSVYVIPLTAIEHGKGGGKRRKTKSKRSRRKYRRSKRRSKRSSKRR